MHAAAADGKAFFNVSLPIPNHDALQADRQAGRRDAVVQHAHVDARLPVRDRRAVRRSAARTASSSSTACPRASYELRVWHETLKAAPGQGDRQGRRDASTWTWCWRSRAVRIDQRRDRPRGIRARRAIRRADPPHLLAEQRPAARRRSRARRKCSRTVRSGYACSVTRISSPIVARRRPVLRRSSRARQASCVSPGSHLPPGNSHRPAQCVPSSRRVTRKRPSRSMTAARTTIGCAVVSAHASGLKGYGAALRRHRAGRALRACAPSRPSRRNPSAPG